jgi:hypothetical protein
MSFASTKDNDTSSDVWVDIERIDGLVFETGKGFLHRVWNYTYDWKDFNPDDTQTVEKKKIIPMTTRSSSEVPVRMEIPAESGTR